MIEAVNSAISNAPAVRAGIADAGSVRSFAADVQAVESVSTGTSAPFIVAFDTNFDRAILQVQDSATGDVLRQIPTERTLELRQVISAREAVEVDVVSDIVQSIDPTGGAQSAAPINTAPLSPETATIVTAQSASGQNPTSTTAATQTAIAALSAGAQSGQSAPVAQVDTTA